jgi:hypothetical protein
MIGKWFGEATTDDDQIKKWITERRPDGSLRIHFRTYKKTGGYKEQIEVGLWGVSGPIYFTIINEAIADDKVITIDPTDAYFYDAYEIIKLTEQEFEYKAVTFSDIYKVKRVPDDFRLPEGP